MKKTLILFLALFLVLGTIGTSTAASPNGDQVQGDPNGGEGQGFGHGNDHDGDQGNNNDHGNGNGNDPCDDDDQCDDEDNECDDDDQFDDEDNECDNDDQCDDEDNECDNDRDQGNSEIGNLVWDDLNANGIQDPNEPGLAGVTVNLWTGNQYRPIDQINTTVTNATGNYIFTNLKSGIYWLEFIAPDSVVKCIFSPLNQGTNDTLDSDANAAGIAGPVCLERCESDLSWDAGLYRLAAVGDKVWLDVDKDGLQDSTEPGIAGVIVNLWTGDATGPLVKTIYSTVTDANGNYIFTNLVPGIYWLEFILPNSTSGFFTLQNQGLDDAIDSDVNSTGFAGPIELISGEVDLTWDAGVDPGAAGGEEEPTDGAAGGDEEIIEEIIPEEVAAAGEVALQETGVPMGLLVMAVLMVLAGLGLPKRK
ncbi:SdrD B-like domain-containing protein [Methanobacterium oryzae]|uniref:SdrD B-like domain-containing protein n=1 Tax=Methanobacterium oryzae TaxID=69540 RepID=UPI003D1F0815